MLATQISDRALLQDIARRVMDERGLEAFFSDAALEQMENTNSPGKPHGPVRDMREMLWCSIDNDDSRDLDQLTVAEELPGGRIKIYVAVADVDSIVPQESPIDRHARTNTTSVYTGVKVFPMLPEKFSTDLCSLNPNQDRLAIVSEMTFDSEGNLEKSSVYRGYVRNQAKLAYNGVFEWLDGKAELPPAAAVVPGLEENLLIQDKAAQALRYQRFLNGALDFKTIKGKPQFEGQRVVGFEFDKSNRATQIIEEFVIAANGVTARLLDAKGFPAIRRVVRSPERWERIVEVAAQHDYKLPSKPNSKALEGFLKEQRNLDELRFPDLCLTIIKLMGPGEYVAEQANEKPIGHFGLALRDYNHSTAPNRRYPDLITQRLLKAAIAGEEPPYTFEELTALADHCTKQENAAKKTERQVGKSAAALLLQHRIGEVFEAIVTGHSKEATWVRLLDMPVEGRLMQGNGGVDVGDRLKVRLTLADVERGYIDFKRYR